MNEKDFAELAAGRALHALSPDDERAFLAALAEHPEWDTVARADVATAAHLAAVVPEAAPPLTLRSELLRRIATLPQGEIATPSVEPDAAPRAAETSEPSEPTPPAHLADSTGPAEPAEPASDTMALQALTRRTWTRGLFALAASFVLLLGLGFGAVLIGEQLTRPVELSALSEIENAPDGQSATVAVEDGGVATAHWSTSLGKAVVVTDGLPAIAADQSYELWYVRDGTPIAAGVFTTTAAGNTTVLMEGAVHSGDTIAVTVEQAGGSPDGQPTSDPVFTIPTA